MSRLRSQRLHGGGDLKSAPSGDADDRESTHSCRRSDSKDRVPILWTERADKAAYASASAEDRQQAAHQKYRSNFAAADGVGGGVPHRRSDEDRGVRGARGVQFQSHPVKVREEEAADVRRQGRLSLVGRWVAELS